MNNEINNTRHELLAVAERAEATAARLRSLAAEIQEGTAWRKVSEIDLVDQRVYLARRSWRFGTEPPNIYRWRENLGWHLEWGAGFSHSTASSATIEVWV